MKILDFSMNSIGCLKTKACKKCNETKTLDKFYLQRASGQISGMCKVCKCADTKRRNLGRVKTPEQIAGQKQAMARFNEKYPGRAAQASRISYIKNKEKVHARGKAWNKTHPEYNAARMAKRRFLATSPNSHTPDDILEIAVLQRYKCVACKCDVREKYHVDHITPVAKGGGNEKTNIQLLCPSCNCKKSAKHSVDFMQEKGYLL